jgi:hypothetical protein
MVFVCASADQAPMSMTLREADALHVRPFSPSIPANARPGDYWQPAALPGLPEIDATRVAVGTYALSCGGGVPLASIIDTGAAVGGDGEYYYSGIVSFLRDTGSEGLTLYPVYASSYWELATPTDGIYWPQPPPEHRRFASDGVALRLTFAISGCAVSGGRPDRSCTPGVAIPSLRRRVLCDRGYASRFPPIGAAARRRVFAAYGLAEGNGYRVVHLVGLRFGGTNDDPNLWPIPASLFGTHARLEQRLTSLMCRGTLAVRTARRLEARDWRAAARSVHA